MLSTIALLLVAGESNSSDISSYFVDACGALVLPTDQCPLTQALHVRIALFCVIVNAVIDRENSVR